MSGPRPPISIDDPADQRLADYTSLTDVELRRRYENDRGVFVVEGFLAIDSLLRSRCVVKSVLVNQRSHARLAAALRAVDAPVYLVDEQVMRATVGFDIHRGAIASAYRPPEPALDELVRQGSRLLVLEGVNDSENLGALFRNSAAFGTDAVLLDPTCADPLYRRSVRVSLGHVLHVPFARVDRWPQVLDDLHETGWTTVALTPSGDETIDGVARCAKGRIAVLVGAEGPGLSAPAIAAANHRARIPMAAGVDSLNVATAAAIALYALGR